MEMNLITIKTLKQICKLADMIGATHVNVSDELCLYGEKTEYLGYPLCEDVDLDKIVD